MAKRRRATPARSHPSQTGTRPGFSRRQLPPPSSRGVPRSWLIGGGLAALVVLLGAAWFLGWLPGSGPAASPSPSPRPTIDGSLLHPPSATPLASPPAEPAGDGTRATIETALGNIVIELYTVSSPVATENFINLAQAGFYDGVVFHRIISGFMIQGGDPEGTGGGGPGYEILDDPVVGEYVRGIVAMARPANSDGSMIPDSQGSQFFIMVADKPQLAGGGYSIFGNIVEGMDVVDQIVAGESSGSPQDRAVDPVVMQRVTIQRP